MYSGDNSQPCSYFVPDICQTLQRYQLSLRKDLLETDLHFCMHKENKMTESSCPVSCTPETNNVMPIHIYLFSVPERHCAFLLPFIW